MVAIVVCVGAGTNSAFRPSGAGQTHATYSVRVDLSRAKSLISLWFV
jgi:hypothetical protein